MDEFHDSPTPYKEHFIAKSMAHLHHVEHPIDLPDEVDVEREVSYDENGWACDTYQHTTQTSLPEEIHISECLHDVYDDDEKEGQPQVSEGPVAFRISRSSDASRPEEAVVLHPQLEDAIRSENGVIQELHLSASVDLRVHIPQKGETDVPQRLQDVKSLMTVSNFDEASVAEAEANPPPRHDKTLQEDDGPGGEEKEDYYTWTQRDLD